MGFGGNCRWIGGIREIRIDGFGPRDGTLDTITASTAAFGGMPWYARDAVPEMLASTGSSRGSVV